MGNKEEEIRSDVGTSTYSYVYRYRENFFKLYAYL